MLDYSPTKAQKLLGNPNKSDNPTASSPACAGLAGEHCITKPFIPCKAYGLWCLSCYLLVKVCWSDFIYFIEYSELFNQNSHIYVHLAILPIHWPNRIQLPSYWA